MVGVANRLFSRLLGKHHSLLFRLLARFERATRAHRTETQSCSVRNKGLLRTNKRRVSVFWQPRIPNEPLLILVCRRRHALDSRSTHVLRTRTHGGRTAGLVLARQLVRSVYDRAAHRRQLISAASLCPATNCELITAEWKRDPLNERETSREAIRPCVLVMPKKLAGGRRL